MKFAIRWGCLWLANLAAGAIPYETDVGRDLVKTTVTRDHNHPSIVMWANGNHKAFNPDFEPMFYQWDIQDRYVLHNAAKKEPLPKPANPELPIVDTRYYPTWDQLNERLNGRYPYLSMEALHGLYDGGGGASLSDYWKQIEFSPLGAGLFIWAYLDECIERTDKNGQLDCAGNRAPDGIVGPYRSKEDSYYAIKDIWSPVQIQRDTISSSWNQQLWVENRYAFTNLNQVQFSWKLVSYYPPSENTKAEKILHEGHVSSPDIIPQNSGFLQLDLPSDWMQADAIQLTATNPHGREIYKWSFPIKSRQDYRREKVSSMNKAGEISENTDGFVLCSKTLEVTISKENGYITQIKSDGKQYSLTGGPRVTSEKSGLQRIRRKGKTLQAIFSEDSFTVNYSIRDNGLKVAYSYRPKGKKQYYGI